MFFSAGDAAIHLPSFISIHLRSVTLSIFFPLKGGDLCGIKTLLLLKLGFIFPLFCFLLFVFFPAFVLSAAVLDTRLSCTEKQLFVWLVFSLQQFPR